MTEVDRVVELFERANPVPDVDGSPIAVPPFDPHRQPAEPATGDRTRRPWIIAAAAAMIAALVAGVVAIGGDDRGNDPAPAVEPTLDSLPAPEPEVTVAEPNPLEFAGPDLVAGEPYSSVFLGVGLEFTLPRDLFLATSRAGVIVMIDGFDNGTYTPDTGLALDLRRWAGWSTRDEAALAEPTASIAPDDIDGWIASNDIIVLDDTTREIAGRQARVIDVTVDPLSSVQAATGFGGGCFPGWEPCFHMGAVASADEATRDRGDWVSARRVTRIYLVPIEGSEPLLITAGAPPGSTWFDEVESTFVESLVIGPDRPPLGN